MSDAPGPGSPEWVRLMTASKVAAVLGLSPWESPRSLWHKMRGEIDGPEVTDAMRRGHYLESGVLSWWRDRHPEVVGYREQDYRPHGDWAGSTPDAYVEDDGFGNRAVVDAKTTADDDGWGTPGTDEAPAHYVAAAMWQMWTHSADIAYVAVLFGRPRLEFAEYVIQRDDALIAGMVAKCKAFHDSLTGDVPPALDDTVATYEAVRKLHPEIDRDAAVELTRDEAVAYTLAVGQVAEWEARAREAKATVLDRMGRARIATYQGQTVARRQPNKSGVSLVAVAKTVDTEGEAA